MTTEALNIGVIGYGLSAKIFHIPFITDTPGLKLYAIVQRTPKPDDDASKDHPIAKVYNDTAKFFEDGKIDIVVITTTPPSHFELARSAIENGKHVIVEKPFTPTSKEAFELARLAKEHKKVLTVYQNRRWDADYLTLSKILKDGLLGRVAEFETHFDRHRIVADKSTWKGNPAPGGGVVYDLGTHLIDQVVHSFGMPKRVTGFVSAQREGNDNGVDDACTILLHYDTMLATIKAGVISPEVEQLRYWVRGTHGSFKKFHLDIQEDQLKAGLRPGDQGYGIEPETSHGSLTVVENGEMKRSIYPTLAPATYSGFYKDFVAALQGKKENPVSAEDGANLIRLVELAKKSSDEGRTLEV